LSLSVESGLVWVPEAAEIAREAGARLREFFARGVETEYKGDVDLVTVADRTCEALIKGRLAEAFPEHGVYGEEGTRERMDGEFRWYVDPLDGTTNFAHGFPQFCVSLGLEQRRQGLERRGPGLRADEDGEIVAGVIYDPMRDELFTAERGKGAMLNGQSIGVSKIELACRVAGGDGVSEPQAARQSEHPLLPRVHAAVARGAAGRVCGAGPGVRGVRSAGGVLGVQPESVGYGGRRVAGGRGGRADFGFQRWAL
jgi:fructose-1,6-bisphosphatase/inositol monophosphatase family enzyme